MIFFQAFYDRQTNLFQIPRKCPRLFKVLTILRYFNNNNIKNIRFTMLGYGYQSTIVTIIYKYLFKDDLLF